MKKESQSSALIVLDLYPIGTKVPVTFPADTLSGFHPAGEKGKTFAGTTKGVLYYESHTGSEDRMVLEIQTSWGTPAIFNPEEESLRDADWIYNIHLPELAGKIQYFAHPEQ